MRILFGWSTAPQRRTRAHVEKMFTCWWLISSSHTISQDVVVLHTKMCFHLWTAKYRANNKKKKLNRELPGEVKTPAVNHGENFASYPASNIIELMSLRRNYWVTVDDSQGEGGKSLKIFSEYLAYRFMEITRVSPFIYTLVVLRWAQCVNSDECRWESYEWFNYRGSSLVPSLTNIAANVRRQMTTKFVYFDLE